MAKDNKSHQVKTSEGSLESVKTKEKEPVVEKMRVEDSKKKISYQCPPLKKNLNPMSQPSPLKLLLRNG